MRQILQDFLHELSITMQGGKFNLEGGRVVSDSKNVDPIGSVPGHNLKVF